MTETEKMENHRNPNRKTGMCLVNAHTHTHTVLINFALHYEIKKGDKLQLQMFMFTLDMVKL